MDIIHSVLVKHKVRDLRHTVLATYKVMDLMSTVLAFHKGRGTADGIFNLPEVSKFSVLSNDINES